MIQENVTMDSASYAFNADKEEQAYQALETYVYQHMSAPNSDSTLAIPTEFRQLIDNYIKESPYVDTDYDFLNLVFRTASVIIDKYHAWRDYIEKFMKAHPEYQSQYDDFVRYQEHTVVRY